MGALCWVLPPEEDEETLQEEQGGGVASPGGLLDQVGCCLGCRRPDHSGLLLTVEQVHALYQTFPEGRAAEADVPRNPYIREGGLQPAGPAHLSVCQRLRKVIQELHSLEVAPRLSNARKTLSVSSLRRARGRKPNLTGIVQRENQKEVFVSPKGDKEQCLCSVV